MYAVTTQHRRGARGNPNTGQRVGVYFILLNEPLTFFVYVDAAVLTVMDFIVPHNRIAICTYL